MSNPSAFIWPEIKLPCDACLYRPAVIDGVISDSGNQNACEIYSRKPHSVWENQECPCFEGVPIRAEALLLGLAVGDALGVPAEFRERGTFHISDMSGYGSHMQPAGTWSDDTSLALCLAATLTANELNLHKLAENFVAWKEQGAFTAHGEVFDIGNTTSMAINRFKSGMEPEKCGGKDERDNGNGSLMRIAPLVFYMFNRPAKERFKIAGLVSSLTHAHPISVLACFIFLEYLLLLERRAANAQAAYIQLKASFEYYKPFLNGKYLPLFNRILQNDVANLPENQIKSDGFVVHTLEAAFWSFLNSRDYRDAALKAVNLGEDADTTGAVTGAMAGLYYGISSIPLSWLQTTAKYREIQALAIKMPRWRYLPGA